VDQALRVRGVEGRADLRHDRERPPGFESAVLVQDATQVAPLDVSHRDVEEAIELSRVVDGDDVGVVEAGGGA
jgi:hypothetical protein